MTCKRIFAVVVVCVLALGSVGSAQAAVVFSEDWSGATGTALNLPPTIGPTDNYSQLGLGTYYLPVTLPGGWSQSGQVLGWSTGTSTTISGVLLNEGSYGPTEGAITLTSLLTGLHVGSQYRLSFNYWGDNRPTDLWGAGSIYGLVYTVGGASNQIWGSWDTSELGTFNTANYFFTALASSVDLSFASNTVSASQASPIIGEVTVCTVRSEGNAVPEPATIIIWSLLATLAIGLGCWRKRSAA